MRAVVVYESMYGNTHLIADAIGDGLRESVEVTVVPVDDASMELLEGADLVVVGGPTHAHGMSRLSSREMAVADARKADGELVLDPDAEGQGLRDWFETLDDIATWGAAFDTRFDLPAVVTGRASKGIARKLHHRGCELIAEPESFFVTKKNHLLPDEETRAREWGSHLGAAMTHTDRLLGLTHRFAWLAPSHATGTVPRGAEATPR